MWPSWPVSQALPKKKPSEQPMLAVMNMEGLNSGRAMASIRKTVLPVWLEAKAWKSGKETASVLLLLWS